MSGGSQLKPAGELGFMMRNLQPVESHQSPHLLPHLNQSHKVSCHSTNRNKAGLNLEVMYLISKTSLANAM